MGCWADCVAKIMWKYFGTRMDLVGMSMLVKNQVNYECVKKWLNGWDWEVMFLCYWRPLPFPG